MTPEVEKYLARGVITHVKNDYCNALYKNAPESCKMLIAMSFASGNPEYEGNVTPEMRNELRELYRRITSEMTADEVQYMVDHAAHPMEAKHYRDMLAEKHCVPPSRCERGSDL